MKPERKPGPESAREILRAQQQPLDVFFALQKPPAIAANAQFIGILFHYGYAIVLRVDTVRYDLKVGVIFKLIIHRKHVAVHNRANGWATGKKEIGHVNFPVQAFIGNAIAILVYKFKSRNGWGNGVCNRFAIYCFGDYLFVAQYR